MLLITSPSSFAGNNDLVKEVYSCGDDVIITMKDAGKVVIIQSQVGQVRTDRMTSIALTLLVSGKRTGYFNAGTPVNRCGVTGLVPITVLSIKAD